MIATEEKKEALKALRVKLFEAKEPSRELDVEVAIAFGKASPDTRIGKGSVTGFISGDGRGGYGNPIVDRYTESQDAAVKLMKEIVPKRWYLLKEDHDGEATARIGALPVEPQEWFMDDPATGFSSNIPMALLAALCTSVIGDHLQEDEEAAA